MKTPQRPPSFHDILGRLGDQGSSRMLEIATSPVGREPRGRYLHWDELRRRSPPVGFTSEEWWLATKLVRRSAQRTLSICDSQGRPFAFTLQPHLLEALHRIDKQATWGPIRQDLMLNADQRDRYLVSSLIEESIRSSQIEGASTTQQIAKEMLRTGRRPKDRSEWMIYNNFVAMERIRELRDEAVTVDMLLELQRIVTDETLNSEEGAGRVRRDDDRVLVVAQDNVVLHSPVPERELQQRLEQFCALANGELEHDEFLHPVLHAILLHFFLAWIHPFVDGNGRTARAMFYWAISHHHYELLEFASISKIIFEGPAKYVRAFLYTETDDNDLTYFMDYHLSVISRAIEELVEYLQKKTSEVDAIERLLHSRDVPFNLNHRQLALLSHALRHPGHAYTIKSHEVSHRVAYLTARADLLGLENQGLLVKRKRGRELVFRSAPGLEAMLNGLSR